MLVFGFNKMYFKSNYYFNTHKWLTKVVCVKRSILRETT